MQNINKGLIAAVPTGPKSINYANADERPVQPPVRLKQIALPTEHGGWGLLLEPIVVGLSVSFSTGGLWIALMTIGAFLTRQPLKTLLIDRLGMRVARRAKVALVFVVGFGLLFAFGLAAAVAKAGLVPLTPFLAVLPLAAVQIYFDCSRKSRNLLAELGGAIAISASVAAITLAGGFSFPHAVGLWAILVARLVPSILYVRERLLEEKGKPFSRSFPLAAHLAALGLAILLAYYGLVPVLAVVAMTMLLARSVEGLSSARRKMKAMKIGVLEVAYGMFTVLFIIAGHYADL